MSELKIREETLLQKSDDAAKALRSEALQDAMVLPRQATKTAESGATDVAAKALVSEAAETAEALLARVKQLEGIIPAACTAKKFVMTRKSGNSLKSTYLIILTHGSVMGSVPNVLIRLDEI